MLRNSGQMLKNIDGICQAVPFNVVGSRVLINSVSASHPFEREKDLIYRRNTVLVFIYNLLRRKDKMARSPFRTSQYLDDRKLSALKILT